MKRIIFCCDGTWQAPQNDTNVYKIFKAIEMSADQVPCYDDGVGADGNQIEKLLGGATGEGITKKIQSAYAKIAHLYEAGDEIYLFGFSRGAYTARALAGMIAHCGLPAGSFTDADLAKAWAGYRTRSPMCPDFHDAKITMVGVWDTVGSLGIPAIIGGVDPIGYGFLDTSLHPDVLNAYHAMSIDEKRVEFPPTLWTGPTAPGQACEQRWFPGTHGDVGGGEADSGLADCALTWMMGQAAKFGLRFTAEAMAQYGEYQPKLALDVLHDSWNIGWGFPKLREIPGGSLFSPSVFVRYDNLDYRPQNLPAWAIPPAK